MNILILGSGGREHAIAAHVAKSADCDCLYIAPGNPGTAEVGTNLPISGDFPPLDVKKIILDHAIHLVIIGPEGPLESGLVDVLEAEESLADVLIFGPTKAAAQLETSKTFAKSFMRAAGIPTADYAEFTVLQVTEAKDYVRSMQLPIVIKADGLAAGKGVIIAQTLTEAETAIDEMFDGRFGNAGNRILIEQFLTGREFSVFIAIHGDNYVTLPVAKDYKKVYDHDLGPNTGGMGSVSPVPFVTATMMEKVHDQIIEPTVLQLQKQGIHYTGFIFFGLIAVGDDPFVIEYNARFGDPEAESVFPRIQSDMVQVITDLMCGRAVEGLALDQRFATGIYVTTAGYPESYPKGVPISLTAIPEDNYIFHGGTQRSPEGKLVNSGGRVLFIGAMDVDLETARTKALAGAKAMDFDKKHFRTDIGYDAC